MDGFKSKLELHKTSVSQLSLRFGFLLSPSPSYCVCWHSALQHSCPSKGQNNRCCWFHRKEVCLHLEQEDMDSSDITPQTMKSTQGKCLSSWEMSLHRLHVEGKPVFIHPAINVHHVIIKKGI